MNKSTGHTLLEAILTLALISLVLVITSGLMSSIRKTTTFSQSKSKAIEAADSTLGFLKSELLEWVEISVPAVGGTANSVSGTKFFPQHIKPGPPPARLEFPYPASYYRWEPTLADHQGPVRFELVSGLLTFTNLDDAKEVLAEVDEFQVQRESEQFLTFNLTLKSLGPEKPNKLKFSVRRW